jgi:hypothetical protein
MDRSSYPFLIIGGALVGAATDVVLSVLSIGGAALDGAVGVAVVLWLGAWTNFRVRKSAEGTP